MWEDAARSVHNTHAEMGYTDACDTANTSPAPDNPGNGDPLGSIPWYAFYGDAGRRMPTAPPGWHRCGTLHTGWLATPHPPVGAAGRHSGAGAASRVIEH